MIAQSTEWTALREHARRVGGVHLRDLFADDPARGDELVVHAGDLRLDYSKNRITRETIGLLLALAERAGVARRRDAMFRGERINVTEGGRCCTPPCARRATR